MGTGYGFRTLFDGTGLRRPHRHPERIRLDAGTDCGAGEAKSRVGFQETAFRGLPQFWYQWYQTVPRPRRHRAEVPPLLGEDGRDGNTCREDLLPEEAVDQGLQLEGMIRKEVEDEHKAASKKGGKTAGKGRPSDRGSESFATPKQDNSKRTMARTAAARKKPKQEGRKKGGGDRRSAAAKNRSSESFAKAIQDNSKRTTAKAAAAVGMSGRGRSRAVAEAWGDRTR